MSATAPAESTSSYGARSMVTYLGVPRPGYGSSFDAYQYRSAVLLLFDNRFFVGRRTEFGLTGGLFSQRPERLAQAREDLHVGNLYLNRKITGAMVGVHPFGGFNMSGTDSKTGGPDYLLLYLQGKSIAEKV